MIGVNPIRTGYNAVADEWVGITPGTDGLFILSLVHELMQRRQDRSGLPGALHQRARSGEQRSRSAEHGLLLRDEDGKPLVIDRKTGKLTPFDSPACSPTFGQPPHEGVTHRRCST